VNRAARSGRSSFVFSDPFSWSTEAAREEEWLGGTDTGPYAGRGFDTLIASSRAKTGGSCLPGASRGRARVVEDSDPCEPFRADQELLVTAER